MHTTGLKLSLLTLATGGLEGFDLFNGPWWTRIGLVGMIIAALCYVYNDMRKGHRDREANSAQHAKDLMLIMTDHKNDIKLIVREQAAVASSVAEIAAKVAASSNEVMRDNIQIMVEVKGVIAANTAAITWCRDSTLARQRQRQ